MTSRTSPSTLPPALVLCLVSVLAIAAGCYRETMEAPPETARVLDDAEVLSERQRRSIIDYLEFIESRRGVDYRVVVMDDGSRNRLGGDPHREATRRIWWRGRYRTAQGYRPSDSRHNGQAQEDHGSPGSPRGLRKSRNRADAPGDLLPRRSDV